MVESQDDDSVGAHRHNNLQSLIFNLVPITMLQYLSRLPHLNHARTLEYQSEDTISMYSSGEQEKSLIKVHTVQTFQHSLSC